MKRLRLKAFLVGVSVGVCLCCFGYLAFYPIPGKEREKREIVATVVHDAVVYGATSERIAERLELAGPVEWDPSAPGDFVLSPDVGLLGFGSRIIIRARFNDDHRCVAAWVEHQPVGWP